MKLQRFGQKSGDAGEGEVWTRMLYKYCNGVHSCSLGSQKINNIKDSSGTGWKKSWINIQIHTYRNIHKHTTYIFI